MAPTSQSGALAGATSSVATPRSTRRAGARERLLDAALVRFEADGALAATLEDIRAQAGVSVGALYHHFPNKAALAEALYLEVLEGFQEGFLEQLRTHPDAEEGIKAGVRFHLRWVAANRSAAALLFSGRPDDDAIGERNRRFFAEAMGWWQTHVHYGVLRSLPFDLINALWLGPAQEFARHRVAGRSGRVPPAVADVLAESAWQSLRASR
jgi:AcrR family transcriptional regulator